MVGNLLTEIVLAIIVIVMTTAKVRRSRFLFDLCIKTAQKAIIIHTFGVQANVTRSLRGVVPWGIGAGVLVLGSVFGLLGSTPL